MAEGSSPSSVAEPASGTSTFPWVVQAPAMRSKALNKSQTVRDTHPDYGRGLDRRHRSE